MTGLVGCPVRHRPWVHIATWTVVLFVVLFASLVQQWWSVALVGAAVYVAVNHPLCRYVHHRRQHQENQ